MKKKWYAVMYSRLSREDGDNIESESIINQKEFIRNYLKKQDDIILLDNELYDYIDDGYTGGNFERPSWLRLMKDIEEKNINTIITKDLSRMGRDYIKMGEYIEKIFPEKGIRYIAINDDIDTLYETPGREYLLFKLMYNDFFLKDTSKKIRKILKSKKENGQYTGWKGIYGYKRDPKNIHKLIVDEEVKSIVIRMFNLVKEGYSPKKIADIFTSEGIQNPSTYKNLIRGRKKETSHLWCPRTIKELLENETYIGNLVQGRRKKVSYKSKKEIRVPKEEWIIVKNTHEKIIDEETFYTVQELLKKNNNKTNKNNYLLKGFLYCKECNHLIGVHYSNDKKRRYCSCCYYTAHSKYHLCTPHSLNYDKLEKNILDELRNIINNNIDKSIYKDIILKRILNNKEKDNIRNEVARIELRINQLNNYIDQAYRDKIDKIITIDQYNRIYLTSTKDIEELIKSKELLESKYQRINNIDIKKEEELINIEIEEFLSLNNPSRELLSNLIDKIIINKNKEIEIYYKFKIS